MSPSDEFLQLLYVWKNTILPSFWKIFWLYIEFHMGSFFLLYSQKMMFHFHLHHFQWKKKVIHHSLFYIFIFLFPLGIISIYLFSFLKWSNLSFLVSFWIVSLLCFQIHYFFLLSALSLISFNIFFSSQALCCLLV